MNKLEDYSINERVQSATQSVISSLSGAEHHIQRRLIDNVFSFTSCSGGCGTSTLVANLALALAKDNFSVLIIDLDIMYPVQHIFWNLNQRKSEDLYTLLTGETTLGDSLQRDKGVSVLCCLNRDLIAKNMADTEQVGDNMQSLLEQASSLFDVVLLDIPTAREFDQEATYRALDKSDFIFLILSECTNCITNLYRIPNNLRSIGVSQANMHYVLNKRTDVYLNKGLIEKNNIKLSHIIPYEKAVLEAGLYGKLFIEEGVSTSKNAIEFVKGVQQLKETLLECGGYVEDEAGTIISNKQ